MAAPRIHPTAVVDPEARLAEGCEVGPYCVIGPQVELGAGCLLQNHVVLHGPTRIGENNTFFPFAVIGHHSQDLKYEGEPTYLEIGNGNTFRECVTVHRATGRGDVTRIGNNGNFLAYTHIAHDCIVGDGVIFSNNATLAGHVIVEDNAVIGGLSAVHQFCRIGRGAITGGCSKIVQDVPPYMMADGNPAGIRGVNQVGMERRGYTAAAIRRIREAYRLLYRSGMNTRQAMDAIHSGVDQEPEVELLLQFIRTSRRGIIRSHRHSDSSP